MKSLILYIYPKCTTCKKASKWLNQNTIKHEIIDITKEPPNKKFLDLALQQFSSNKKKVFNTRGNSFKLIDVNIEDITNKEIIQLLFEDGKLIKRTFLVLNKTKIITGFNESEYVENLL